MRLIAIIPARAGSKGLSGKNMRMLGGKPLVQHAIEAALTSAKFEHVYVTSDDGAVLALAKQLGAVAVSRPESLASDTATMTDVIADFDGNSQKQGRELGDAFALLQPSSPLRSARHIVECVDEFGKGNFASAVSVCACKHAPQKALLVRSGKLEPMLSWNALQSNRQDLEPAYRQNGIIWIVTWTSFRIHRRFVVEPAMPFIMRKSESIDIDTLPDLEAAESVLASRSSMSG